MASVAGTASAAGFNVRNEAELIAAINRANAHRGPDLINVTADITLHAALPLITDALTIRGSGGNRMIRRGDSGDATCSPTAASAFRLIDADADLRLSDLRLSGGCNLVDQGGAVRVQNAGLRVERSVVTGNQTFVDNPNYYYGQGGIGGGIAVLHGSLTLVDSTLRGNATHGNLAGGGGAAAYFSDLRVVRSTVSGNLTNGVGPAGAGIYAIGDYANGIAKTVTIADSVFADNVATGPYAYGGGLGAFAEATTITNSRFYGNRVVAGDGNARGAGINVQNPHLASTVTKIDRCTVSDNAIAAYSGWGAGLRLVGGLVSVSASSIFDNRIDVAYKARGGGLWIEVADATLTNTTISDNTISGAAAGGGGLAILSEAPDLMTLAVYNSTIAGNQANGGTGGGLWLKTETDDSVPPTAYLESTILAANQGVGGLDDIATANNAPTVIANHSLLQGSVDLGDGSFTADAATAALAGTDPLLLPLGDNGGATLTRALDPASPAIGQGTNALGLPFDQRGDGYPRAVGSGVDIGAFERKPGDH